VLAVLPDGPLLVALRTALREQALSEPADAKTALKFVAETADPATAIAHARQLRPDLALIDIPIGGFEAAQGIRRQSPETRIVFLTGAVIGPDQATSGLAHAYIFRDSPPATIAAGIANLIRGDSLSHDDPAPAPPPGEKPPPLDLPLRDPLAPRRTEAAAEGQPERPEQTSLAPQARSALPHLSARRMSPHALLQPAIAAAVGLALLIAALLGAGGAALGATGFALATLAAAATLNPDPLVRRFLPPLAAALFVIVALSWGATADRSFAADGIVPALIVLAGLGALWHRAERTSRPVPAQAPPAPTPPTKPPTTPELNPNGDAASAPRFSRSSLAFLPQRAVRRASRLAARSATTNAARSAVDGRPRDT
jgi:DNA-binding NarL/FixJ family response regulator